MTYSESNKIKYNINDNWNKIQNKKWRKEKYKIKSNHGMNKICISQKGGAAAGRPPPPPFVNVAADAATHILLIFHFLCFSFINIHFISFGLSLFYFILLFIYVSISFLYLIFICEILGFIFYLHFFIFHFYIDFSIFIFMYILCCGPHSLT